MEVVLPLWFHVLPMALCFIQSVVWTHVVVVLLEVNELLLQGFDLTLQVHAAHVGVVDELPQTHDVGLHGLADGQLRLKPGRGKEEMLWLISQLPLALLIVGLTTQWIPIQITATWE